MKVVLSWSLVGEREVARSLTGAAASVRRRRREGRVVVKRKERGRKEREEKRKISFRFYFLEFIACRVFRKIF